MASQKGLGKGLGALLGDFTEEPLEKSAYQLLPIYKVEPNPDQPRQDFDEEELQALADSITVHGIIQPLTVREMPNGYYQIIAGERRWRAARMANLSDVPAVIIEADDKKAMELALIENLQRQDLNPLEEALGYQTLMNEYGLTQEEAKNHLLKNLENECKHDAALKIKEITYVHAEGYGGGALKHGPFALIEDGTPVIMHGVNEWYEPANGNPRETKDPVRGTTSETKVEPGTRVLSEDNSRIELQPDDVVPFEMPKDANADDAENTAANPKPVS